MLKQRYNLSIDRKRKTQRIMHPNPQIICDTKLQTKDFRVEREDNNERRPKARNSTRRTNERAVSKRRTLTGISKRNSPKLFTASKLFSPSHIFLRHHLCHVHARPPHTPCPFHPLCTRRFSLRPLDTSDSAFAILSRSCQFSFVGVFVREPFICRSLNPTTSR